jgi:hypothetical protein
MNKKRQVVSKKVREYVRQIMNNRNIDTIGMEKLRKEFENSNCKVLKELDNEYRKTQIYRNGMLLFNSFYSYNDRFYKLLRDGGVYITLIGNKMVICLE